MDFPLILANSVWHTTTEERFAAISKEGLVQPEPDISDSERCGTAMGPEHYPYVRSLGGVSLFDFRGFEEDKYEKRYPLSMWREFVPCRSKHESAIWIEMNLAEIGNHFIDGVVLLAMWKESGQLSRKIMPLIESAHIGPISTSTFGVVLRYQRSGNSFEKWEMEST